MSSIALPLPMNEIRAICERYRVAELAVFGSAVRDDFREDSDVDFLVTFQTDARIGLFEFGGMQIELEDVLRRKVDLESIREKSLVLGVIKSFISICDGGSRRIMAIRELIRLMRNTHFSGKSSRTAS